MRSSAKVFFLLTMIRKSFPFLNRHFKTLVSLRSEAVFHGGPVGRKLLSTSSESLEVGSYVLLKTSSSGITDQKGYVVGKASGWWTIAIDNDKLTTNQPETVRARLSTLSQILDVRTAADKEVILSSITSAAPKSVKPKPKLTVQEMKDDDVSVNAAEIREISNFELKTIEAPAAHREMKNWIIFSDLHVKSASIDTCEVVLKTVHDAAVEKNAGIIFLGDFWHVRGALCVDLLNRVLFSLKQWKQPVIMIPGNHDQVSLGGAVHALEPLSYVFAPGQILLISEPVICMGALWIPYRRNPDMMKAILTAGAYQEGNEKVLPDEIKEKLKENEAVSIIFCHADIQGASMNDGMRCREGLDISAFPPNIPIYSGHFHKPHTMARGKSSLRYVGSPYQTSLSEAGQEKYLYNMDSRAGIDSTTSLSSCTTSSSSYMWREQERWPIDIGTKYFRATSVSDPITQKARKGDRVVIPVKIGEDVAADALMRELKDRGVDVELRKGSTTATGPGLIDILTGEVTFNETSAETDSLLTSDSAGNEIAPIETIHISRSDSAAVFRRFIQITEEEKLSALKKVPNKKKNDVTDANQLQNEQLSFSKDKLQIKTLFQTVLSDGVETIERVTDQNSSSSVGERRSTENQIFNLDLHQVSLSNFGPYGGGKVHYPLQKRGLVLIRGQSSDRTGADSNGSGKTTLAMSVMWALTGSMDLRLVSDSKATDVAYDSGNKKSKRTAEVKIEGAINGDPFSIVRKRGERKSELFFTLGGVDLTTQAVKETQVIIEEKLGIGGGLLQRCCFFGQHSHTLHSLLGLTDSKLKNELSALVDTSIWTLAQDDVKKREKNDNFHRSKIEIECDIFKKQIVEARMICNADNQLIENLKSEIATAKEKVFSEIGNNGEFLDPKFAGSTSKDVFEKYNNAVTESARIRKEEIEPLNEFLLSFSRSKGMHTKDLVNASNEIREKLTQTRTSMKYNEKNLNLLNPVIATLNSEMEILKMNYTSQVHTAYRGIIEDYTFLINTETINVEGISESIHHETLLSNGQIKCVDASGTLLDVTEPLFFRSLMDGIQYHSDLRGIKVKADERTLKTLIDYDDEKVKMKMKSLCPDEHDADACPTCGQTLSDDLLQSKKTTLSMTVKLENDRLSLAMFRASKMKTRLETIHKAVDTYKRWQTANEKRNTTQADIDKLNKFLTLSKEDESKYSQQLNATLSEINDIEQDDVIMEVEKTKSLRETENKLSASLNLEKELQSTAEKYRKMESIALASQSEANSTILVLEERLKTYVTNLSTKTDLLQNQEQIVEEKTAERNLLIERSVMLGVLSEAFGPKGIQHYLFKSVIKVLEEIANCYLLVLAEGGIQLSLDGQEMEKIVKSVNVRSADGTYIERCLSSLSGGQWRRVSMSLDFAFAEVIRRKGALRCNLMVMDEVLTHLDATGREGVGSVLRAMVDSPTRGGEKKLALTDYNTKTSEEKEEKEEKEKREKREEKVDELMMDGEGIEMPGIVGIDGKDGSKVRTDYGSATTSLIGAGSYETVIVILQDLAAKEIEEAFDSIDVVVKDADTARVVMDGGMQ